jgi:hypothetical protein
MIKFKRIFPPIINITTIAVSGNIRDIARLRRTYGGQRWSKKKGQASIELLNGDVRLAELHWYEAHSIGKKEIKVKRLLD